MAWTLQGRDTLKSDVLLLVTAAIWGFAFVAQRAGMEHVGPFGFNGIRFALGCLVLLPLILACRRDHTRAKAGPSAASPGRTLQGGLLAGGVLFAGASFQQVAMVYTQAVNAGFITGLYVIIVPIMGVFLGHKSHAGTWIGAVLAVAGMYLLSVTGTFKVAFGDVLVFIGAIFWACHVHVIGWVSPQGDALGISFIQYAVCSALSVLVSAVCEDNTAAGYISACLPILYGGIVSVGVAYTLQVVAQKKARPSHAALIMCLEAVFAAIGGHFLLGEVLTARGLAGCALMLAGMFISQLWGRSAAGA
jgi:drug/metabolite transporter (DMT)-like permease